MSGIRWRYRPALDGLRALAVYLVVAFHAGVPGLPGGFVGVDLFFVLSGFLVTSILLVELDATGRIDLLRFYDRRVRRLLPAAVVVVVVSCAVAFVTLSAVRRAPLVGDGQASLLYVANWRFLSQTNDYFDAGTVDSSIFLHFWSLSIEEQFYVAFPILLLLASKAQRRTSGRAPVVGLTLGLLFVGSLGAQVAWAFVDPAHAYYGTDARLYQLLAGALLAVAMRQGRGARLPERLGQPVALVAVGGLVLVSSSVVDLGASLRGVLAVGCSVALIRVLASEARGPAGWLFSRPPVVYLGRISYGTYLWHWPVIVVMRELLDPGWVVTVALVGGLSTALASASFHMLEQPIRSRRPAPRLRGPVVAAALAVSALVAVSVVPGVLDRPGQPALVAGPERAGPGADDRAVPDIDYAAVLRDEGGEDQVCTVEDLDPCARVTGQDGPDVLLVGDSHARTLEPAMTDLARDHGFNLSVSVLGHCPWQRGLVAKAASDRGEVKCAESRTELYERLVPTAAPDIVVLTERPRDGSETLGVGRPPGDTRGVTSWEDLIYETTTESLQQLAETGVRVLVVESMWVPELLGQEPLECLATAATLGDCSVPVVDENSLLDSLIVSAAAEYPQIYSVDINPAMCPRAPVCEPVLDGIPVWRDSLHYTPAILSERRALVWQAIEGSGVLDDLPDDQTD